LTRTRGASGRALFDIPAAAWSHPLGVGYEGAGHPTESYPMIDDGPWAGVPIGGLGSGSIGRTQRGDFARWHLRVGTHVYRPVPACQFSVYVGDPAASGGQAHVLSTLRPDALPTWGWDLPEGAGTYRALFPRAWTQIDWDALPVEIEGSQLSPVVAGNLRESSYPVGVFEWRVRNPTDRPIRVGFMFSWQNLDEDAAGTPTGAHNVVHREGGAIGVVLRGGDAVAGADPLPETAILAAIEAGAQVTYRSRFDVADGADVWSDFAQDGALDDVADDRPAADGQGIGAAVAVTLDLAPGEERSARFALAWDTPVMRFGAGTGWYRRYTRFFGRDGGHAAAIAAEGLARQREWEAAIAAWQAPILDDPARPDWYKMALFNELYVLVDGGTAWEDGRVGEPPPDPAHTGFAFLECFDYPYYNTHDVIFYGSWALAMLWPELERRVISTLAASIPDDDPRPVSIRATGAAGVRKVTGAAPHDIGMPSEDPWLQLNAYDWQDPNDWKDLNSKFVLQLWRDRVLFNDPALVAAAWPAVETALDWLAKTDTDGDGLPDHDGADQTFDTWSMRGPSAYAGGLWLAALSAGVAMATEVGETAAAERFAALRERAGVSFTSRLWNGTYLRFDGSGGADSESIMADQLCGLWYADATGLPSYLDAKQVRSALQTVVAANVRGFQGGRMGAVNGMWPDGTVDRTSSQSSEVWPGVTYGLAALLLHRGMDAEAWETAEGAVRTTYERGFWFRTPEAWDEDGNFRASIYMRPLSIWAMEHALRSRG
jgi:non-lysosomal glucosylceramidase